MMTRDEAAALHAGWDTYLAALSRFRRNELAATYRVALFNRGQEILYGGPATKDELISALLLLRYPAAQQYEAIHVLWHKPGESWSACQHCHPHAGERCECELGRVPA